MNEDPSRDRFICAALTGYLANTSSPKRDRPIPFKAVVEKIAKYADAALKEARKKDPHGGDLRRDRFICAALTGDLASTSSLDTKLDIEGAAKMAVQYADATTIDEADTPPNP